MTRLDAPLTLPCGAVLKNRLIKAAMSDSLGDGIGNATAEQCRLYERWAIGGTSLSLIGEAQIIPDYPEKPGNIVLTGDADLDALRALARAGASHDAQIWPQLGHAGALSHAPISTPKGPSPLNVPGLSCDGLSVAEIETLPLTYAKAAEVAKTTGFGGVQIHAGHGFLFSQFLSPLFNHRKDAYGGSVEGRFKVIADTIAAVRTAVGAEFPVAIKINSSDQLQGGLTEADALKVIRLLNETSIDLIDISGGTYFPGAPSSSDGVSTAGPYFVSFAKQAKAETSIPIMVTGGIKTRAEAVVIIETGAADAVGLGRSLVLDPDLPNTWMNGTGEDPVFPKFSAPPEGGITAWYSMRLTALAHGQEHQFPVDLTVALANYNARDAERSVRWAKRFHSK